MEIKRSLGDDLWLVYMKARLDIEHLLKYIRTAFKIAMSRKWTELKVATFEYLRYVYLRNVRINDPLLAASIDTLKRKCMKELQ